jgi:hypothetical protein
MFSSKVFNDEIFRSRDEELDAGVQEEYPDDYSDFLNEPSHDSLD